MSHNTVRIPKHPSYAGSSIALFTALCVAGLISSQPVQLAVVGIEALGGILLLSSGLLRQRGKRIIGLLLLGSGSLVVCFAVGLSIIFPVGLIERGAFVSGVFGSVVVLLGLYPIRAAWSRNLVGFGVVLLGSGIVVNEWVAGMGEVQLLLAVLLTILTWDVSAQAISLGEDVGRSARTFTVAVTHAVGSLAVGILAFVVAFGSSYLPPLTIPVVALALLLGAALLFLFGLFLRDYY